MRYEKETLQISISDESVHRKLPARFIISGPAEDLRFLASSIMASVGDDDVLTKKEVLISLPLPVKNTGGIAIGWNERIGE